MRCFTRYQNSEPKYIIYILGIGVAAEYNVGQELMESKNFKDFAEFFQGILENGRRHKIMNPGKKHLKLVFKYV